MTNQEAIEKLKWLLECSYVDNFEDEENEALEIAIKALEQEPKTGHWIVHPKGVYAHLVCDKCLSNAPYDCRTNYCPNCGAKNGEQRND